MRCSVFIGCILGVIFYVPVTAFAQISSSYTVDIYATVPGCGDGFIQGGEQCDGSALGGASCSSIGFGGGSLSCSSVCTHITSACSVLVSTPGGGSSGATRTNTLLTVPVSNTNIVITGYAPKGAMVRILKDGQAAGVGVASDTGYFQVTITGLAAGDYTIQASASVPSLLSAVSATALVTVITGATTKVEGLVVRPIITLIQSEEAGIWRLDGVTVPLSTVSVVDHVNTIFVVADTDGRFSLAIPREVISKVSSVRLQVVTPFGGRVEALVFVSQAELMIQTPSCQNKFDTNDDCRVNIIDFTRAVRATITGLFIEKFDYDKNGRLDLTDFSIMAFYWTG